MKAPRYVKVIANSKKDKNNAKQIEKIINWQMDQLCNEWLKETQYNRGMTVNWPWKQTRSNL